MTDPEARTHGKSGYHHGDLRSALVDATRQLVEDRGPSGFTVAEAARRASVSTAAPYRHFKDRTALLHAVAEEGMNRLSGSFDARIAHLAQGSVAAISELGCAYVDFARAEPNVFRLMFADVDDKPESLAEAGMACFSRLLRQVALHLGTTEEADETVITAMPLWMMVHGAAFLQIDGKLADDLRGGGLHAMIARATQRFLAAGPCPAHADKMA